MALISINRLKPTKFDGILYNMIRRMIRLMIKPIKFGRNFQECDNIFVRCEVGGWPPLVLCFEHSYDRDAVLGKAHLLERQAAIKVLISTLGHCPISISTLGHCSFTNQHTRTGILITEDMARGVREQWGELRKFMLKVSGYTIMGGSA